MKGTSGAAGTPVEGADAIDDQVVRAAAHGEGAGDGMPPKYLTVGPGNHGVDAAGADG